MNKTYVRQIRINGKEFNDEFEGLEIGIGSQIVVSLRSPLILYSNLVRWKENPLVHSPTRVLYKEWYPLLDWQCDKDLPLEVLKEIFLLNMKEWETGNG